MVGRLGVVVPVLPAWIFGGDGAGRVVARVAACRGAALGGVLVTVPPPPAVPGELIEKAAAVRPHRCGRCDARWSGGRACHCAGCHETFTGLASFDYHRAGDECRDPRAVKKPMSLDGYGRWGWPETEGQVRGVPRRARSDEQPDPAPAPVRDAEGPQIGAEGFATMRPYWHGSQPGGTT